MSNIDYKAEVLKVHPKAFCTELKDEYIIVKFSPSVQVISVHMFSELSAWQNAYEQLKKEGKIK